MYCNQSRDTYILYDDKIIKLKRVRCDSHGEVRRILEIMILFITVYHFILCSRPVVLGERKTHSVYNSVASFLTDKIYRNFIQNMDKFVKTIDYKDLKIVVDDPNHVEIMIPGPLVGRIIGRNGQMLKYLEEKSGTNMLIIQNGWSQGIPQKLRYRKF